MLDNRVCSRAYSSFMTETPTFLLCPPEFFTISYEINPWMQKGVTVDPDKAMGEWTHFRETLEGLGANVVVQPPQPDLPDMVYTANAGFVANGAGLVSRFASVERQGESAFAAAAFEANGMRVEDMPEDAGAMEGTGDAIIFGDGLFCGYGQRTDASALPAVEAFAGAPLVPVHLIDPRFYHLDLVICPLDAGRQALVAPQAMDADSLQRVRAAVPEPVLLEDDEVSAFCANAVVVEKTVLMHRVPPRLGRVLADLGFDAQEIPVPEFIKGGGSLRCLSLRLDAKVPTPIAVT